MTVSVRVSLPLSLAAALACSSCQMPAHAAPYSAAPPIQLAQAPQPTPAPALTTLGTGASGTGASDTSASASDLYQVWKQTYRTDHTTAYDAAENYLKSYPDGPNAPELGRWVAAFEKVTGRPPGSSIAAKPMSPPPSHNPLPGVTPPQDLNAAGPSLAETEDWLVGWLGAHNHATPDSWTSWRFDACRLYIVVVRNGCYRRSIINFSEVDPTALKAYSISQGADANSPESMAIMLRSSSERPVYHADQAEKNLGAVQSPVPGDICGKDAFDEPPEPVDRTAESYFAVNTGADPFAKDDIGHALNGVTHLVKLCGGKPSPF